MGKAPLYLWQLVTVFKGVQLSLTILMIILSFASHIDFFYSPAFKKKVGAYGLFFLWLMQYLKKRGKRTKISWHSMFECHN